MRTHRLLLCALLAVAVNPVQAQMQRFAWLSDTHVGNPTGAEDLRASVRDINRLSSVDFVILSGDITEYGSDKQLLEAKSILDSLSVPYHIIPGNHDTKWSPSGATTFRRLWGDDKFVFTAGAFLFIGMHEGPVMRMGDGQFSPEDIRWLDSLSSAMRAPLQPIIFVTHYPLDQGIANWYEVLDRLERLNTQLVLVGHGHRNRIDNYEGIPGIMGRSNLRGRDSVGGYTIGEIRNGTIRFVERRPGAIASVVWDSLELAPPKAPVDTSTRVRPDFSLNTQYAHVRTVWARETGWTTTASPVQWGNALIIGNSSGAVSGYSLTDGSTLWEFKTGGPIRATAAVADGYAVFGSTDGKIYCINATNGSLRWSHTTGAPVVACPTIHDGTVYCGSSDGVFRALSLDSGKPLWQYNGVEGFVETKPVIQADIVVFGAWDERLYGLDARSGTLRWMWQGDRPGVLYSPAACWPVAAAGRVFVTAPDRTVSCIDLRTGKQLWRTGTIEGRETIGISEDGSRVFVRTIQDSIVAIRSGADDFKIDWVTNAGFGYDINSAMIREQDGILYYGTKNGLVLALDSDDGKILWKHRISAGLVNSPLALENGAVAFAAYDGRVLILAP